MVAYAVLLRRNEDRSASELLSGRLHEEWIVKQLAPELARALHLEPRHAAFGDLGLEDPCEAAAERAI